MTRYQIILHTEFDRIKLPGVFTQEQALAVVKAIEVSEVLFVAHIKDIDTGKTYALDNDEWVMFD